MKYLHSFITLLLCASILALSVLSVSAADGYIRGDADGDGIVTIFDATVIQRHLIDVPVVYINEKAADIDGNALDISDVTRIQRYLAGMDNPFSIGEYVSEKTPADYDEYELPVV